MGGMPGMGGRGGGGGGGNTDNTRYYKLLNVSKNASEAEIKKAHRKACLREHPDKGGDEAKFKEINEAYDILRDPEKRDVYDKYGEDAAKESGQGGGGGGGMADIFDLFGGGGGRRAAPRERRGEDVLHRLKVTLEELYNGGTRKLSLARNIKCSSCSGTCTKSGRKYTCVNCNGQGATVQLRALGPGMMQQVQAACGHCSGTGNTFPPDDLCQPCSGRGMTPEKKVFEIHIAKGQKHGDKITLRGEAGCPEPSMAPGDVVFVLEQKDHRLFKRITQAPSDLILQKTISLREALTGLHFHVRHLDGRTLQVDTQPGEVIKPDSWRCIDGEGMPIENFPLDKGNLYVQFSVQFPESLNQSQISSMKQILPQGSDSTAMDIESAETASLRNVSNFEKELQQRKEFQRQHRTSAYDESDEEDGPGPGRVQCAQQ